MRHVTVGLPSSNDIAMRDRGPAFSSVVAALPAYTPVIGLNRNTAHGESDVNWPRTYRLQTQAVWPPMMRIGVRSLAHWSARDLFVFLYHPADVSVPLFATLVRPWPMRASTSAPPSAIASWMPSQRRVFGPMSVAR